MKSRAISTVVLLFLLVMPVLGHGSIRIEPPQLTTVSWDTFFHTEGRDIVADSTGEKVFFRGVNPNGLEFGSFFDNPYPGKEETNYFKPRTEDFNRIKALGFNVIRVPFEWARLVTGWQPNEPLPTALDPKYLGILAEIVQMAAARQIHVILDMHDFLKYWSGQWAEVCVDTSPDHQQLLARTWELLATHFRDNPAVLGYDIMNEPVRQELEKKPPEHCSSCNWHAIAQSVVDAVRTVDTNHLIFVEGPNYSLASDWPVENGKAPFITDRVTPPRIVYSPHVFFDFNNDSGYNQPGEEKRPIGQWQYYMRDRLLPVIDWSIDNNVPIFIGETGVPCTDDWANLLEHAFVNFFDPLRLSVTAWHYINPEHCPPEMCPLNLAACPILLEVLEQHPGRVYEETGSFTPTPSDSLIYNEASINPNDARVNPWDAGDGYWGEVEVDLCTTDTVFEGNCSIRCRFNDNFDGIKFIHHYGLDTRRFTTLRFWIYLTGAGQQDFKFFTTAPLSDCNPGDDPEYPPYLDRPTLTYYLPSPQPEQWQKVEIPLQDIVNPAEPIISGIAFQNMGKKQDDFYLDDIRLVKAYSSPDLTIYSSDISFDPPGPADPGTPVTIRANIHNEGGTDATCDVSFYYDDTSRLIGKVTGHPVAASQSETAQVVWNTTDREPRKYPVIVVISNTNPAESNTSNNSAQDDYTLPVELASFEAQAGDGEILLKWVTESETDNYGWNIYRATDPEGTFSRINLQAIPGAGTTPVAHFYSYLDLAISNGTTYYYYLEDIWLDGNKGEKSFMVSATPNAGNAALNSQPFKEEKKYAPPIPPLIPYPGELEEPQYFPIPQAKILVEQKGSYRITYYDLAAAGIDVSGIDTRHLTLSNKGKPVPLLISDGGDGRLDNGDYLELEGSFNPGSYTYEDIYSRINIYWLSWWPKTSPGATGVEILPKYEMLPGISPVDSGLSSLLENIHLEEDHIFSRLGHAPDGQRDHWFWAQVDAPGYFSIPFMINDYKPISETVTLKVRLQGNSHLAIKPDHYVQLFLNERALGEIRWDGQADYLLEKEVPVSSLTEGANILKIVVPGLEGLPMVSQAFPDSLFSQEAIDSIFLDWLEISYWSEGKPEKPMLPFKPRAIVPDFPSNLRNHNNGADYIIITHSDFYERALRLASFREQGGLRTKVVDITDIYDEFSYGIFNPEAIKSFLQYAYRHWQRPAPRYVLLLGDASEDYKDNSHTGSRNYVPPYPYFSPGFGQTISDHWFACLEGKDEVPELSIGRLTARTAEEAEVMVDKVINYSASAGSGRVLFIDGGYDKEDEEFFDGSSEGLIERYLGDTSKAVRVYGQPSRGDLYRYQGSRDEILKAINAGVGIINFLGHAASRTWDLMFNKKDIAWLNNRSLPFVVSMTCHTGHFATTPGSNQGQGFRILTPVTSQTFPGQIVMLDNGDSFGEAFLKKRDGGAIAFLGNTAMGLLYGDSYLDESLFRAIFHKGITTLGPAIDEAKRLVLKEHPGYQHMIATFVILGDPALELRVR